MDVRFTVGEMAQIAGVSKQTLIYYDRMDVFKPRLTGAENGYRYYTADQLEQLDTILMLRDMGFPLKEIRRHMEQRSTAAALDALTAQKKLVHNEIRRLQTVERNLTRKLEEWQRVACARTGVPFFQEKKAQLLAVEPVHAPQGLLEVDLALKRLLRRANQQGYCYFYQLGDCVSRESLAQKNFLQFEKAFVPLLERVPGESCVQKPAGRYACIYHQGPYTATRDSYEKLLAFLHQQGITPAGPAYEFFVLDSMTTARPEEYLTEIQIPVE